MSYLQLSEKHKIFKKVTHNKHRHPPSRFKTMSQFKERDRERKRQREMQRREERWERRNNEKRKKKARGTKNKGGELQRKLLD